MSFGSVSDNGRRDMSGEVGSSMEVGWMIGYVSSKSMGAGEGERSTDKSRTEVLEEVGDEYSDACVLRVCAIGWFIARCAKPCSKVEHLRRLVEVATYVRKGLERPLTRSWSSLSDEDDEGDGGSFRLLDGMLNHGCRIAYAVVMTNGVGRR